VCTTPCSGATRRYAADIVALHDRLSHRQLRDHLPSAGLLHEAARGDGLMTVALPTEHLPHRYLLGLKGFRLAQYLQLGWACEQALHRSAGFCEPLQSVHSDDVHVVTYSSRTGRVLGYLSLTSSGEAEPRELRDPAARGSPSRRRTGVDLFDAVPGPAAARRRGGPPGADGPGRPTRFRSRRPCSAPCPGECRSPETAGVGAGSPHPGSGGLLHRPRTAPRAGSSARDQQRAGPRRREDEVRHGHEYVRVHPSASGGPPRGGGQPPPAGSVR
jgi:hypothetical protein